MEQPVNAVITIPVPNGSEPIRATLDPATHLWTCPDEPTQRWLNISKPYPPPTHEPGTYDPNPLYTVALSAAQVLGGKVEYCYQEPDVPGVVY